MTVPGDTYAIGINHAQPHALIDRGLGIGQ